MDLNFTAEERAFREEVRAFLATAQPEGLRRKMLAGQLPSREDIVQWHRILDKRGWSAPMWPEEWGGAGWSAVQFYIFVEEILQAPALPLHPHINQIGPVIARFGSAELKQRFLPRIRTMEYFFCSGLSEPGAGSDLASLKTRAERSGDHYVVNGQKLWTTYGHVANWMYTLVRTDPAARKQSGISFLLIDMSSPGITVKPVNTLSGVPVVNEVFFNDVRVPVENRIGEENRGWSYVKHTLGVERMTLAKVGSSKSRIRMAKQLATRLSDGGRPLAELQRLRERIALIEVELKALEITNLRLLDASMKHGQGQHDTRMSILKLRGSEIQQAVYDLLMEIAGPLAMPLQAAYYEAEDPQVETIGPSWAGTITANFYHSRCATIVGGSNEIQHNILSKAVLGL